MRLSRLILLAGTSVFLLSSSTGCKSAARSQRDGPEIEPASPVAESRSGSGSAIPVRTLKESEESEAFYHFMMGVDAELDAVSTTSEPEALESVWESIGEYERVVQLGFSTPEIRLSLARNLRLLAARAPDEQLREFFSPPRKSDSTPDELRLALFLKSRDHYKQALEHDNESEEALEGLLSIEREVLKKPVVELVEYIEKLAELRPKALSLWFKLGHLYLDMGAFEKAREVFVSLSETAPQSGRVWYQKGRSEYATQRFEEAANSFAQVLKIHESGDEFFDALRAQAACYEALQRPDLVADILKKLVREQPKVAANWVELARFAIDHGQFAEARQALAEALFLEPNNFSANVLRGQILFATGQDDQGLEAFNTLTELWPARADSWEILGRAQLRLRRYSESVGSLRRSVSLEPSFTTRFYLAEALRLSGESEEAEAILTELATEREDAADVLQALFFLRLELEEFTEAYAIAARFHELGVNHLSHYMLGASLERLGRLDEAIVHLKKAIALKPDFASARNYLGYLYADHGIHLEDSIAEIRIALELDPGNGAYLDSLGWAYYKAGKLDDAMRYLQMATETLTNVGDADSVIFEHLGDVYRSMGCLQNAVDAWTQALELVIDVKRRATLTSKLKEAPAIADAGRCGEIQATGAGTQQSSR